MFKSTLHKKDNYNKWLRYLLGVLSDVSNIGIAGKMVMFFLGFFLSFCVDRVFVLDLRFKNVTSEYSRRCRVCLFSSQTLTLQKYTQLSHFYRSVAEKGAVLCHITPGFCVSFFKGFSQDISRKSFSWPIKFELQSNFIPQAYTSYIYTMYFAHTLFSV